MGSVTMSEQAKGSEHELNAGEVEAFESAGYSNERELWQTACAWQREQDAARIAELEAELAETRAVNLITYGISHPEILKQASQVGEPVAMVDQDRAGVGAIFWLISIKDIPPNAKLYLAPPAAKVPDGLIDALRHQRQVDEDGTECGVNRQAVDVAIEILESLAAAPKPGEQP